MTAGAIRPFGDHAEVLIGPRLAQAWRNLALFEQWVDRQDGRVRWTRPDGSVCAFPRLNGVADIEDFRHQLMHGHGVLLVPGTCSGYPDLVRLGFGGKANELADGLEAIGASPGAI